jgi:hypothetical protein
MGIEAALFASAAATAFGASRQASAAKSAAQTQAGSAQQAMQQQREMFDILNAQQAPYRELAAGEGGALSRIREMLPMLTSPVTAADIQGMPGYQFGLQQGLGAVGQAMNVGGGGSNIERARQRFAIDYTMGQALPAYLKQRESIYNTLAGIAGLGQTATQASGQVGMGTAGAMSQLGIGAGSALAAGQIGAANAMAGGLQGIGNLGMMYSLMRPAGGAPTSPFLPSTIGAGGGADFGPPAGLGLGGTPSDRRLKRNVTRIATRPDGLGVYEFEYVWGGGRRVGLMAQEVRELYPDAVSEMPNGHLAVDYRRV